MAASWPRRFTGGSRASISPALLPTVRQRRRAVLDPLDVGAETGILRELRLPEHVGAQRLPLAFVLQPEDHLPPIARAVRAVRGDGGVGGPAARRGQAAVMAEVEGLSHPLHQGLE